MELKDIKEIINLVSEKGFAEFELQRGEFRLKISSAFNQEVIVAPKRQLEIVKTEVVSTPTEKEVITSAPQSSETKPQKEVHKIKSPIVGTFYAAASPTSEAFVKIGSQIKPGTVLCIVEAMKLMNEIESDIAGEIVEIYVENSHPVEYGQPLFGVKVN